MENRNYRLKKALEDAKVSQEKLAKALNKTSQAVNERLNKDREIDSLEFIETVAKLTGYSFEWLRSGTGPEKLSGNTTSLTVVNDHELERYAKGENIRPITVVTNPAGKELVSYVPVKAQAGYRSGYKDPEFMERLPAFSLPVIINNDKSNRMFQVDGNSMRQPGGGGLNDGDIVFAELVEDWFSLKDGRVYVVVTKEDVLVKRVINRLKTEARVLVLNSDNKSGNYPAIIAHLEEIHEVWEYKAHLSRQLPMNTDLFDEINDLKVSQALQEDKIKHLENMLQNIIRKAK